MKIFDWFTTKKVNNSSASNHAKDNDIKRNLALDKEMKRLKKLYGLLQHYFVYILSTEKEIDDKIKKIKIKTGQNLLDEQLVRELWVLRYSILHIWFFDFSPPANQNELEESITLINHACQSAFESNGKNEYLPWLKQGFIEYSGTNKLEFNNLKKFNPYFTEKLTEKISRIAFECTEGRLGGELHDFVVELIMTTIQKDQKAFTLSDDTSLTAEELLSIETTISDMKLTKKDFEDALDSLRCPEK